MKKFFTTLALVTGLCIGANAQTSLYFDPTVFSPCQGATNNITPGSGTTPGLSPSDTALPCAVRGSVVSDTIYFTNFTQASGQNVQSLKIDSLYLPAGLCWSSDKANSTYGPGENGVIYVTGTTNVAPGRYKLRIIVDVNIGVHIKGDAEVLASLRYYVRVACAGDPCPRLDKTDSTHVFVADAGATCTVGVTEVSSTISGLTVSPNPFASTAHIAFASEVEGTYTMKMTNLLGAVVSSKEVNVVTGSNNFEINRNGISAGIYTVSISNGQSAVSKKVIIE
ncbi:MAG: hypothetical protein JWO03_3580 [Bacteroidetes bacterium]|nr:hypothetical protein [Bacteroidota bacterium]